MKILSISSLFPTPLMKNHGVFVENRLLAMAETDNDISVINPIPSSPIHKLMRKYEKQQKSPINENNKSFIAIYRPRFFSIPGFIKHTEHYFLLSKVRDFVKGKTFDAIDVHWTYPDAVVAEIIAKELGIPYFVTLRGTEAFYPEDKSRSKLITKALSNANGLISLSESLQSNALSLIGENPPKSVVIRNGVDTIKFSYIEKGIARTLLGLNNKDLILLGVGGLIQRKGFHHVIDALGQIGKQFPDRNIKYYILGEAGLEGDFSKELGMMADVVNSRNDNVNVVLGGAIKNNELYRWYNAADLFCLSSYDEGSPNVLTEALSCGCPAVTNDVGSASEILNSEPNMGSVISIPIGDRVGTQIHEFWSQAITIELKKEHERELQAKAMSKYTWGWCAKKAIDFISNGV